MLRLSWVESHGPPVAAPAKRGFGANLIERSLRYALGGEVRLGFEPGESLARLVSRSSRRVKALTALSFRRVHNERPSKIL